jgi:hypothetical protein
MPMLPWLIWILAVVGIFFLWRGYLMIRQQILRKRVAYMLYLAALNPQDRERYEDRVED